MHSLEEISGTIDRVLFQNHENGYVVFILQGRGINEATVCGTIPTIQPGQEVMLTGAWTMHPKFGKQFEAKTCTAMVPTTIVGLKKYLGSGLIKGIGPIYAEKLVAKFGMQVLTIIEQHPSELLKIDGIGPKRVEKIVTAWKDQKEIATIMVFLQDKGISTAFATKIYKTYRQESIAVIQENPYQLAQDIWGVGFKTADTIAQQLGFDKNSLKRIRAGISHALSTALTMGHLYQELQALKKATIELLELDTPDVEQLLTRALHDVYTNGVIKLITFEERHFVALSQYYFCEKGVATKLKKLCEHPPVDAFNIHAVYDQLRAPKAETGILLNDEQIDGIMRCVQSKVTVITGGPGTGKTTLIKTLLQILDEHHIRYQLAAPTGRAAKRIIEGTGRHALTIHRLLEFDMSTMSFTHNERNSLKTKFLIIDEASMIDIFLAHALLKALSHDAHLILIGDIDQLPSVGAGNFLHDVIASNSIPCIRLKHIFRQAQNSMIVVNAHRINEGQFPINHLPDARKDFIFIHEEEPESVKNHLETIYQKGLWKFGLRPSEAVVLTPMNRGGVGTQMLNHHLQLLLNPATTEKQLSVAGTTFKDGDRVMQIRNNYDKNVFNGDVGYIEEIDVQERLVSVRFPDFMVEYEYTELDELVLAYALSIHKSQGSEYDAVIIPLFMQHFMLLQRNLLYTAITRAKKLCILIGQPKAIAMAIKNNKGVQRTTFLQQFLTTDLQCR